MTSPPLILASASATRKSLLENAGLIPEIVPARIDEEEIKRAMQAEGASAGAIAETLAEHKACSISRKISGGLVVGADQVLELNGDIFSKPENREQARQQLARLRGNAHRLASSVCVALDGTRIWHHTDTAELWLRNFSDDFLEAYLDQAGDGALNGPGAYQIEKSGIQLFSAINGDYFTILGLPLLPLIDFLRVRGLLLQ